MKQLLLAAFNTVFFSVVMLLSASAVFAQVKIGTNPTSIDAANNLEVESATVGNKVSINKTTGKVTIADGSQGAGKVLSSDANGVATWEDKDISCYAFAASRNNQIIPQTNTTNNLIIANNLISNDGGAYNPTTGVYTIPKTGVYMFAVTLGEGSNFGSGTRTSTVFIQSASYGPIATGNRSDENYTFRVAQTISAVMNATAGDEIFVGYQSRHESGTPPPAGTAVLGGIRFSGSRIDCNKR